MERLANRASRLQSPHYQPWVATEVWKNVGRCAESLREPITHRDEDTAYERCFLHAYLPMTIAPGFRMLIRVPDDDIDSEQDHSVAQAGNTVKKSFVLPTATNVSRLRSCTRVLDRLMKPANSCTALNSNPVSC
jgi:hypothetical protein